MEDIRKALPGIIVLAATGILGAGVLTGAVGVVTFISFISGVILPSPLFRPMLDKGDDEPPTDVP